MVEDKLCITREPLGGGKAACRNINRRGFNWLASVPWCSPYLCGRARLGMLSLVSCSTTRQAWVLLCLQMWGSCHRLGKARAALLAVSAQVLLLGRGAMSVQSICFPILRTRDPTCGLLSFTMGLCFVVLPALSQNSS